MGTLTEEVQARDPSSEEESGSTNPNYFNRQTQQRAVEQFIISYLNRDITVDTDTHEVPYYYHADRRFESFEELIQRYSKIGGSSREKKQVKNELYSMIILLLSERRVKGNFSLEPLRDVEFKKLALRTDRLEERIEDLRMQFQTLAEQGGTRTRKKNDRSK